MLDKTQYYTVSTGGEEYIIYITPDTNGEYVCTILHNEMHSNSLCIYQDSNACLFTWIDNVYVNRHPDVTVLINNVRTYMKSDGFADLNIADYLLGLGLVDYPIGLNLIGKAENIP